MAECALKIPKLKRPQLEHELCAYLCTLSIVREVLEPSTLVVAVIPRQLELIIEREEFLHSKIQTTISTMMIAILVDHFLDNCPDNDWVNKKGGSMRSGFEHAKQIICASVK